MTGAIKTRRWTRRTTRRVAGLSLIELLVVLGLVLAILAIAIPFTLRSLGERELSATEENFASELLKARAQAQESGRPVEVVVMDQPSRIVLRYFNPQAWQDAANESTPKRRSSAGSGRGVRDTWWEESPISSTVRVANEAAMDSTDLAAETGLPDLPAAKADAAPRGGPMRVAVFMPDGSILFAASLLLLHENGLRSRVSVDPWTGHPAIARGTTNATSTVEAAEGSTDEDTTTDTTDETDEPEDQGSQR